MLQRAEPLAAQLVQLLLIYCCEASTRTGAVRWWKLEPIDGETPPERVNYVISVLQLRYTTALELLLLHAIDYRVN